MKYLKQIVLDLDQLINAFLGGMADETISSRAYRQKEKKLYWKYGHKFIYLIFLILFFQKDHCHKTYLSEKQRRHSPRDFK